LQQGPAAETIALLAEARESLRSKETKLRIIARKTIKEAEERQKTLDQQLRICLQVSSESCEYLRSKIQEVQGKMQSLEQLKKKERKERKKRRLALQEHFGLPDNHELEANPVLEITDLIMESGQEETDPEVATTALESLGQGLFVSGQYFKDLPIERLEAEKNFFVLKLKRLNELPQDQAAYHESFLHKLLEQNLGLSKPISSFVPQSTKYNSIRSLLKSNEEVYLLEAKRRVLEAELLSLHPETDFLSKLFWSSPGDGLGSTLDQQTISGHDTDNNHTTSEDLDDDDQLSVELEHWRLDLDQYPRSQKRINTRSCEWTSLQPDLGSSSAGSAQSAPWSVVLSGSVRNFDANPGLDPDRESELLRTLVNLLAQKGPKLKRSDCACSGLRNVGPLLLDKSRNTFHCHLGTSDRVVVWRTDREKKEIHIYFRGSHSNYKRTIK
jgi:hypothetical protein